MSTLHECPCGCGSRIARNMLACRTGWFALPYELQRAINSAFRRRAWQEHRGHVVTALAWYRDNAAVLAEKRARDAD